MCVSDENVQELAGELVVLGLISEVGVLCAERFPLSVCGTFPLKSLNAHVAT